MKFNQLSLFAFWIVLENERIKLEDKNVHKLARSHWEVDYSVFERLSLGEKKPDLLYDSGLTYAHKSMHKHNRVALFYHLDDSLRVDLPAQNYLIMSFFNLVWKHGFLVDQFNLSELKRS